MSITSSPFFRLFIMGDSASMASKKRTNMSRLRNTGPSYTMEAHALDSVVKRMPDASVATISVCLPFSHMIVALHWALATRKSDIPGAARVTSGTRDHHAAHSIHSRRAE
eukprot:6824160-Pyramimonas_sp.AAC.1